MHNWIVLAGRIFIGFSFLGSAILTISGWDFMLKEVGQSPLKNWISHELMPTVLVAKILIEMVGGIFLCFGYRVRFAATALAVLMAAKLLLFHDPLSSGMKTYVYQYSAFLDDAKILGGLLMATIVGAGKFSLDKD